MKKTNKIILSFFAMVPLLVGCSKSHESGGSSSSNNKESSSESTSETQHEHTFSSEWTHDTTHHWHASTCGHDVVSEKAVHKADLHGFCEVCGYYMGTEEYAVDEVINFESVAKDEGHFFKMNMYEGHTYRLSKGLFAADDVKLYHQLKGTGEIVLIERESGYFKAPSPVVSEMELYVSVIPELPVAATTLQIVTSEHPYDEHGQCPLHNAFYGYTYDLDDTGWIVDGHKWTLEIGILPMAAGEYGGYRVPFVEAVAYDFTAVSEGLEIKFWVFDPTDQRWEDNTSIRGDQQGLPYLDDDVDYVYYVVHATEDIVSTSSFKIKLIF